jgi:shikimate kinase
VAPRAVLVGLPGAGKTSAGRALARRLRVEFADSDALVVARAGGRTVRELFAERGESGFRALEADAVEAALRDFPGVLALGGGAVTTPRVRAGLRGSGVPVVLLRASPATLLSRIGDGASRPLLAADPPARLAVLTTERAWAYEEVATLVISTDDRSPGQVAGAIAAALRKASSR